MTFHVKLQERYRFKTPYCPFHGHNVNVLLCHVCAAACCTPAAFLTGFK